MIATRPADFDEPLIAALCQDVAPGQMPVQIFSKPFHGAVANDCFANVHKQIERAGGEQVIGWALWECPGIFAEAEFHAVWRDPATGALLDLNPRPYPWTVISFLPDPARRYGGRQVDNIRKPLKNDPLVKQYLHQSQRLFQQMNTGDLAHQHGEIEVPPKLYKEMVRTRRELERLHKRIFKN